MMRTAAAILAFIHLIISHYISSSLIFSGPLSNHLNATCRYTLPDEGLTGRIELTFFDSYSKGVACDLESPGFKAMQARRGASSVTL